MALMPVLILALAVNSYSQQRAKPQMAPIQETNQADNLSLSGCLKCNASDGWASILDRLRRYSDNHWQVSGGGGVIGPESFFARELLYIGEYSASNSKENGGWAGAFIRISFLATLSDIENNPDTWHKKFMEKMFVDDVECAKIERIAPYPLFGEMAFLCGMVHEGEAHIVRQLGPAFYCYFRENLKLLAKQTARTRYDAMDRFLANTVTEHEAFFENAVEPAFLKLSKFWTLKITPGENWDRVFTSMSYGAVIAARAVRRLVLDQLLSNLRDTNQITNSEWQKLHDKFGPPI